MDYESLTSKLLSATSSTTENLDPLMNRMEDKYLVSRSFLEKLTSRLRENLKDGESDTHVRFNHTNTIYLDTKDLDCFRDAAAGIKPRFKVRIRHYAPNGGKFEDVAYLELKIKTEEGLTKKTRIRVPQDIVTGIANGTFTLNGTEELINLNRDIPPSVLMNRIYTINSTLKKYGFRQQIIISYERRAYANDQIRVTVDDHIMYYDATNLGDAKELIKDTPGFNKMEKLAERVKNTPYVILEVKHRGAVPQWLQDLMKEVKAESVKFSKYATAIVNFSKDGTNSGDISKQGLDVQPLIALFHDPITKGKKSKDLASIAYVVLRDKNFVLVGKRKNNDKWGLPGGRFEEGEDREEVALRELKEETGIKLNKGDLAYEGKKIVETDDEIKTVYIFSGKHPGGEPETKDGEYSSWEWMRCENGMLPAKILEDKMNGPTEAAFEKMGLTKGVSMDDTEALIEKLSKGGPGSGVKGHKTYHFNSSHTGGGFHLVSDPMTNTTYLGKEYHGVSLQIKKKNDEYIWEIWYDDLIARGKEKNLSDAKNKGNKTFMEKTGQLNKGGPGSGVVGHMTAKKPSPIHPAVTAPPAKPINKLHAHLQALEHGGVIPGVHTKSGKPVVTDMKIARAQGYDVQDHVDAMNAHHQLATKTRATMEKLKTAGHEVPKEGEKIAKFHEKMMKQHMEARHHLEARKKHTVEAMREIQAEKRKDMSKAVTQMGGGLGDRDLDVGAYAQARDKAHQEWLEKLYVGMEGSHFGDMPNSFVTEKGTLHLSKVDDGLYSGYHTNQEFVDGGVIEDNAKIRIERITLPELVQLMTAKEWISPVFEKEVPQATQTQPVLAKENFDGGFAPAGLSLSAPEEPLGGNEEDKLRDKLELPVDQRIKLLDLIAKLMS